MHALSKTEDSETKMHVPGCHHRLLNTLQSMLRQRKIGSKEKFMIYTARAHTSAFVSSPAKRGGGGGGGGGRPQKLLETISGLKFISG